MAPPFAQKATKAQEQQIKASQARTGIKSIERDLDIARGRRECFSGRPNVSDDRALRRMKQADETQRFKNLYTKPVQGSSNLLQMTGDAPRSLTEERQRLANLYGPTFKEIGSDIAYGAGKIGSALGQRIASGNFGIMGIAKGLYEEFTNRASQAKDALVKGVDKLSDIDLAILKDPSQFKFTAKKPEIQEIINLQDTQMTELDKADLIRQNMDRVSTNIEQTVSPTVDSFRRIPATGITSVAPKVDPFIQQPGTGYTPSPLDYSGMAPGFEIVSDYKTPEAKMQDLINKNQVNNTNMFDLGINNTKNQLSQLEKVFGVDMQ